MARRSRGTLAVFLLGSVTLHAAVLVALPAPGHEPGLPTAAALEVVLLGDKSTTAPRETVGQAALSSPRRERRPATSSPKLQDKQGTPLPVTPAPREMEGSSITVESARISERTLAQPEQGVGGPTVAPPPAVGAAYLSSPAPSYPLASRQAGEQGTVMLRVRVAVNGKASRVTVEKSSGSAHLDAAALEAVKAWRFTPARRGTEPVESWMLVPVVFRLEVPG